MPRAHRPASKSRIIRYAWQCPEGSGFNEIAAEKILDAAKRLDLVTQYDTGRGSTLWFEGPPGEGMRSVRARILPLLPPDAKPITY